MTRVTDTYPVRGINDDNNAGTSIIGHKTTSPDVVSLEVPPVTSDGPDDTVVHARETCTLGSAFNASPFPKDYCGRSVAGNHSLRGLDS